MKLHSSTKLLLILMSFLLLGKAYSQDEIHGIISDSKSNEVLPYVSIVTLKTMQGVISNEQGEFIIETDQLSLNDTIRFQSIGYATKDLTVEHLISNSDISLELDVYDLNEIIILEKGLTPERIVKNVLEYREKNYIGKIYKNKVFVRERYNTSFESLDLDHKKSSIDALDEDMIKKIEQYSPKDILTFYDNLCDIYYDTNNPETFKVKPIRDIGLKEEDITELENLEVIMDSLFKSTGEKEYWKVKSGIFSQKIEVNPEQDSIQTTINIDSLETKYLKYTLNNIQSYTTFQDKKKWDFIHKTGKYNFEFEGGTTLNDEDVYIISFTPKRGGVYTGKLYIAFDSFALIKADYTYAEGKHGRDFQMLGIGYSRDNFSGSIYFEKGDEKYQLRYFSFKSTDRFSVDRNISLIKKKKRFLIDKKQNEIKVGLDIKTVTDASVEYAVIDSNPISSADLEKFVEPQKFKVIYVDQFDKNLWKGYSIIQPVQEMKEYVKSDY